MNKPIVAGRFHDDAMEAKASEALKQAAYAAAYDAALADVDAAPKLARELGELRGELAGIKRSVNVTAHIPPPAEAKAVQRIPRVLDMTAAAIAAEILRRETQANPEKTLSEIFPKDDQRLVRKSAVALYKAATEPGSTTGVGWAQELTNTVQGSYVRDLAGASILAQLVDRNLVRRLDFNGASSVTYPHRLQDNLQAAWVQENATIPFKQGQFSTSIAHRHKLGVLAGLSAELKRVAKPDFVELIKNAILLDTGAELDRFFLDAEATVAGVRPAGIQFGATTQASAGGTVEQVATDLKAILAHHIARKSKSVVLLLNPLTVAGLSLLTATGTGIAPYAAELATGRLAGLPVIASPNIDPTQMISVDTDGIYAGVEAPEFDLSNDATIVLIDDDGNAPTMTETGAITDAGSVHVSSGEKTFSAFQTNSLVLRFVQPVTWTQTRPDAVFTITGVV